MFVGKIIRLTRDSPDWRPEHFNGGSGTSVSLWFTGMFEAVVLRQRYYDSGITTAVLRQRYYDSGITTAVLRQRYYDSGITTAVLRQRYYDSIITQSESRISWSLVSFFFKSLALCEAVDCFK